MKRPPTEYELHSQSRLDAADNVAGSRQRFRNFSLKTDSISSFAIINGKPAFVREVYPHRIVFSRYATNSNAFPESFPGKSQELFIFQVDGLQTDTAVCSPSAIDYKALCLPFHDSKVFLPISHTSKFVNPHNTY